ncbi:MAG TPA: C4-dicarboxylate ABC transporter, partial [Thiotrichales bacterium]|nr:C4-dicarboxylate ABC transporter [Thiotrichales bacterium]
PDGTFWMKQMRAGAKEIKEKTDGRVRFKFYPGGVMGNDESVMRKIRIRQLQGGAVTNGALEKINPDVTIYGLPFVFSALDQSDRVRAETDKLLLQGLEKNGFVSFGIAKGGFTYMMSKYPIDSIEALRDRKPWVPEGNEVGYGVYRHAGISPVSLPLSDVLTGLQTGLIDTVITSPIGALALQWHTGIHYVVDLPLTYLVAAMVVDKKAFNKLSKADQAVVREVMGRVYHRIDEQNSIDSINARKALINQGIKFISLSDEELKRWYEIGEKVRQEMHEKHHFNKALYQQVTSH